METDEQKEIRIAREKAYFQALLHKFDLEGVDLKREKELIDAKMSRCSARQRKVIPDLILFYERITGENVKKFTSQAMSNVAQEDEEFFDTKWVKKWKFLGILRQHVEIDASQKEIVLSLFKDIFKYEPYELEIKDGLLYYPCNISVHGSPMYDYKLVSDDPEQIKLYEAMMTILTILDKRKLNC